MDKEEITQRLDDVIGVAAFYIGKAFQISKYEIDEKKSIVAIWAVPFRKIDVRFEDMENFFENYSPIFSPKKTPAMLNSLLKKESKPEHFDIPKIPEYLVEAELDEPEQEKESSDDHVLTDEELQDFEFNENKKHSQREGKPNGTLSKTVHAAKKPIPVDTTVKKQETAPTLFTSPDEMKVTLNDVKNILMDNIKKVQEDPKYIPQANTINQSVNSLINLAKLSIQMMNQRDKLK